MEGAVSSFAIGVDHLVKLLGQKRDGSLYRYDDLHSPGQPHLFSREISHLMGSASQLLDVILNLENQADR